MTINIKIMALLIFLFSGCSIYKAATHPGPADLEGIGVGSPRLDLISRFGSPKRVDTDEHGNKQDIFEFRSGFHQASRVRTIPYLAANVFTLGLAELVLWPLELTVLESATCIGVATYDQSRKVVTWTLSKKDGVQGC